MLQAMSIIAVCKFARIALFAALLGIVSSRAEGAADAPRGPENKGIDPEIVVQTAVGRPIQLASGGKPVSELYQ